jgi:hypothetical protein
MNVPTSAQVGRATGSCETPVTPQADSAGDEGVSAVPLAAPSTNTPLAPSTQNAVEDEPVTPRAAAQVETDPLGKAPEGMHNIPHANAKCTEDMNGAANGLTNGSAGPAETLFARRRAETRVFRGSFCFNPSKFLHIRAFPIQTSRNLGYTQILCSDSVVSRAQTQWQKAVSSVPPLSRSILTTGCVEKMLILHP